ncbi:hypothetical protein GCM10027447_12480 [Glycomyces halotolerans]
MPKWLKRQMSLGLAPVIPAGIGLRSDDGHPSGGAPAGNDDGSGDGGDDGQNNDGGDGDSGKGPKFDGDFDKDRAERALAASREAENKAKAALKAEKDRVAKILAAAGLTPDGKEDPAEQLKAAAAERDAAAEKARTTSVELAVYRTAGDNGGDPGKLLDSRAFTDSIKELDPNAADFADKVGKAIKAAVESHPHLAAGDTQGGQGPNRQGVDHSGTGGPKKERPKSLAEALKRARNQ